MSQDLGFESLLAKRTSNMDASAIREILKVVGQPGMISMAGGLPAAKSFPIDLFPELVESALKKPSSCAPVLVTLLADHSNQRALGLLLSLSASVGKLGKDRVSLKTRLKPRTDSVFAQTQGL